MPSAPDSFPFLPKVTSLWKLGCHITCPSLQCLIFLPILAAILRNITPPDRPSLWFSHCFQGLGLDSGRLSAPENRIEALLYLSSGQSQVHNTVPEPLFLFLCQTLPMDSSLPSRWGIGDWRIFLKLVLQAAPTHPSEMSHDSKLSQILPGPGDCSKRLSQI